MTFSGKGPELEHRRPRPKFAADKLTLLDTALLHASRPRKFRNMSREVLRLVDYTLNAFGRRLRYIGESEIGIAASKYLANSVDENRKEFILLQPHACL